MEIYLLIGISNNVLLTPFNFLILFYLKEIFLVTSVLILCAIDNINLEMHFVYNKIKRNVMACAWPSTLPVPGAKPDQLGQ